MANVQYTNSTVENSIMKLHKSVPIIQLQQLSPFLEAALALNHPYSKPQTVGLTTVFQHVTLTATDTIKGPLHTKGDFLHFRFPLLIKRWKPKSKESFLTSFFHTPESTLSTKSQILFPCPVTTTLSHRVSLVSLEPQSL